MISLECRNDAQKGVEILQKEHGREMRRRLASAHSQAIQSGADSNSRIIFAYTDIAAEAFDSLSTAIRADYVRSVRAFDGRLADHDLDEAKTDIKRFVTGARYYLLGEFLAQVGAKESDKAFGFRITPTQQQFDNATLLILQRHEREVEHDIMGLTRDSKSENAATIVQNFYNTTVGAVVNGNNNNTTAIQSFSRENLDQLASSLEAVTAMLRQNNQIGNESAKSELIDLLEETHQEAKNPSPNKLKLVSAIQGIGASLSLIQQLPAAYSVLKSGANALGINLP